MTSIICRFPLPITLPGQPNTSNRNPRRRKIQKKRKSKKEEKNQT